MWFMSNCAISILKQGRGNTGDKASGLSHTPPASESSCNVTLRANHRQSGSYWLSNIPAALMVQPNIFNFWKHANHGRFANVWLFSQRRPWLSMTRLFSEFRS